MTPRQRPASNRQSRRSCRVERAFHRRARRFGISRCKRFGCPLATLRPFARLARFLPPPPCNSPLRGCKHPPTDRWPSGRRRTPGKCVGGEPSRGFESLSVRHPQSEIAYLFVPQPIVAQCPRLAGTHGPRRLRFSPSSHARAGAVSAALRRRWRMPLSRSKQGINSVFAILRTLSGLLPPEFPGLFRGLQANSLLLSNRE